MNRSSLWWRRKSAIAALVGAGALALGCAFGADVVSYELPPEADRYTLTVTIDGVETVWEYHSQQPAERDALDPQLEVCLAEGFGLPDVQGPCSPEPLIFLKYDLALRLDNTVPTNRPHQITVTSYYQERLSELPLVTTLEIAVSYDGGQSWQSVDVAAEGDSNFTATLRHPRSAAGEPVALRVSAIDNQGNSVVQTMPEAFRLS